MISGTSASSRPRDDDAADARDIITRIERVPSAFQEHFDPGAENPSGRRPAPDVTEMAVHVARRDVQASAERESEMGEVSADADALVERLKRRPGRSRLEIVELNMLIHEIADRCTRPHPGAMVPNRSQAT